MTTRYLTDSGPSVTSHNAQTLAAQSGGRVESSDADQARQGPCGEDGGELPEGSVSSQSGSPGPIDSSKAIRPTSDSGPREGFPPKESMTIGGVSGRRHEASRCLTPKTCPEKAGLREPSPEYLRDSLESYYRMRDAAVELRQEATAAGADLRTRLGWASVIVTIDGWIAGRRRELSAIARRGGQGLPVVTP